MTGKSLVICPIYNEQETIEEFYQDLRNYYRQDVLLVDDGSTDRSQEFLLNIKDKNTFVQRHPLRCGYGTALISGFKFALENGYRRIVTIDVDLQHRPEHIYVFLRALLEWEVVLGSRYIKISDTLDVPRVRLIINRYISGLIEELFSVRFTDPFCGFRGYRDSFLKKIFLREKSYGVATEILLEILRTQTSFGEVPIEAIYFKDGRQFLDDLDDPRKRLLHYLRVISEKRKELANEKDIFVCKSSS